MQCRLQALLSIKCFLKFSSTYLLNNILKESFHELEIWICCSCVCDYKVVFHYIMTKSSGPVSLHVQGQSIWSFEAPGKKLISTVQSTVIYITARNNAYKAVRKCSKNCCVGKKFVASIGHVLKLLKTVLTWKL